MLGFQILLIGYLVDILVKAFICNNPKNLFNDVILDIFCYVPKRFVRMNWVFKIFPVVIWHVLVLKRQVYVLVRTILF